MLCIEATAVASAGRITPACLGLWDDVTSHSLASVLNSVRKHFSMLIIIQLVHA
jgi:2,4-dienoyl-CoA reductase-like NADH-dependent reductase (Old Yellow Enzyme family)